MCRFLLIILLLEECVPWPSGEIPGCVAGVVSSELTKGYRCDSGIGCNFRDMVFAVRAWSNASADGAEDDISYVKGVLNSRGGLGKVSLVEAELGKALRCDHTIDVCRGRLAKSSRVMDLCGHL